MSAPHQPVLLQQVITGLNLQPDHRVIDCTVGAGGHATAILEKITPAGRLLGLDRDPTALTIAETQLTSFKERVILAQTNFDQITDVAAKHQFQPVNAILADLGVSSMQLDQAERGFSFMQPGPLDMRMSPQAIQSATDLVNTLPEKNLADTIYKYGEERKSRRIARAIVYARPIETTTHLAETIIKAIGRPPHQKIHPATRTFQALRIAVNDELGALERFLPQAVALLAPRGRLAVISFHSLEDRIVKRFFKQEAQDCLCPPRQIPCVCGHQASVEIITKKPLTATQEEIEANPRARSAKLRIAQRLAE